MTLRQYSPAVARNREPILDTLSELLPREARVLEVASGSGEHAVFFGERRPQWWWQPTDVDAQARASIEAHRLHAQLPNVAPAIEFDVTRPPPSQAEAALSSLGAERRSADGSTPTYPASTPAKANTEREAAAPFDAILCCNMVHIAPWEAALGLFHWASLILHTSGQLVLYGPYRFDGAFTAQSNADFDRFLRERDGRWGVRDIEALDEAAQARGLSRDRCIAMPANNHILRYTR